MKKKGNGSIVKRQRVALIISALFNAFFVALFFYTYMAPLSFSFPSPSEQRTVAWGSDGKEIIEQFSPLTFDALVLKLGSLERDYALACLVVHHQFDLEGALARKPEQKELLIGDKAYPLYPSISDEEYEKITAYSQRERCPFTTEGLLTRLKTPSHEEEPLKTTLRTKPEYKAALKLLQLPEPDLIPLLAEVSFRQVEKIETYTGKRHFLLEALMAGSKTACRLLLRDDFDFAMRQLDDRAVKTLVSSLDERSPLLQKIARPVPPPLKPPPLKPKEDFYVVQQGDSLWKIARKHQTTVEALRQKNGLASDNLKPGRILKICQAE